MHQGQLAHAFENSQPTNRLFISVKTSMTFFALMQVYCFIRRKKLYIEIIKSESSYFLAHIMEELLNAIPSTDHKNFWRLVRKIVFKHNFLCFEIYVWIHLNNEDNRSKADFFLNHLQLWLRDCCLFHILEMFLKHPAKKFLTLIL